MVVRQDANSTRKERKEVREIIVKRMEQMQRMEARKDGLPQAFYACQEAILEEVLRRADQQRLDNESLVALVDLCIKESRVYHRLSTDRGLKSFYRLRIKVLRGALTRIRRYVRFKRWIRRRKQN